MAWPNLLSDGKSELSGQKKLASNNKHDFGKIRCLPHRELWLISSDPSLDWATAIPWLRKHTKLQLWLKGGQ
jgi:(S)-2-hydroxy-acid oxidase